MQPTNTIPEIEPVRHGRKLILALLYAINAFSSLIARLNAEIDRIHEELRLLAQQHPEYAHPNQRDAAAFTTYALMVISAYVVDAALIGVFAEFCAKALFPQWSFVKTIARFLIPLAFICIELGFGAQRQAAKVEAEEAPPGAPHSFAVTAWTLLGILWAALFPAIVLYTQRAAATLTFSTAKVLAGLGPVLMALAFALHVAILFSGKYAHDSKGYIAFLLRRRKLRRQASKATRIQTREHNQFRSALVRYVHDLDHFNRLYPNQRIAPGPFTAETKSLAGETFGPDFLGVCGASEISVGSPRPTLPHSISGGVAVEPVAIEGREDPA